MRTWLEAANTAAWSFSRPVLQRSADFVKRRWASRSAAESFSETSATIRASRECARSPFSVLTEMESEEEPLKRITDARQQAASAAGKSSWKKYSPDADCEGEGTGEAAGFTNRQLDPDGLVRFHTWLRRLRYRRMRQLDANRLFFWLVGFGHLVLEKLIKNRRLVTTQSCLGKCDSGQASRS